MTEIYFGTLSPERITKSKLERVWPHRQTDRRPEIWGPLRIGPKSNPQLFLGFKAVLIERSTG